MFAKSFPLVALVVVTAAHMVLADGAREGEVAAPPIESLYDRMMAGEYGKFDEIVFATRTLTPEHWYANFGYYCYDRGWTILNRQGRLVAYNIRTKAFRKLLEDLAGAVRDPCVHYDGKTILFSYRPGSDDRYHLYTINSDGTGLKQLTFGDYDDIEPAWLPDGDIVFVSSRRRVRWVSLCRCTHGQGHRGKWPPRERTRRRLCRKMSLFSCCRLVYHFPPWGGKGQTPRPPGRLSCESFPPCNLRRYFVSCRRLLKGASQ